MTSPVDGKTVGIEFETDVATSNELSNFISKFRWNYTRDASVETDCMELRNNRLKILCIPKNKPILDEVSGRRRTLSVELVSPVLELKDVFPQVKFLTHQLEKYGEPAQSTRSSVHVHVSLSEFNVKTLKSIILLGSYFEPMFFYLGGMGYKFRGEENDSIYCRPITSYGPPVIPFSGGYTQIFTTRNLLSATNMGDFWKYYGDAPHHHSRYNNPARYMYLNLLRMFSHPEIYLGTLEFRSFNKSLNPYFINAVVQACARFVDLAKMVAEKETKWLPTNLGNSIFSATKDDALRLLEEFSSLVSLDSVLEELYTIIKTTPKIKLDDGYVLTHKTITNSFWEGENVNQEKIPTNQIRRPHFVDIHQLRNTLGNRF